MNQLTEHYDTTANSSVSSTNADTSMKTDTRGRRRSCSPRG